MIPPSAVLTPMNATAVSDALSEGRMPAPPQRHPATPISPYIQEAARRAALPIEVSTRQMRYDTESRIVICPSKTSRLMTFGAWTYSPAEATRYYLDLVNALSGVSQ